MSEIHNPKSRPEPAAAVYAALRSVQEREDLRNSELILAAREAIDRIVASMPPTPIAFEEPPGSCTWQPFKSGSIEGIRRVELTEREQCAQTALSRDASAR